MICPECGLDHAMINVVQEFLNTVRFPNPEASMIGVELMAGFTRWMGAQGFTISPVSPEQVN